ncbi:hypothetical protein [Streptomyces sp. NPDC002133]|uniref:hypothetical protein n=1 Tax=Streptomyces sp. NPDC002133 TaxID=3154409 RepID=UPI003317DD0F
MERPRQDSGRRIGPYALITRLALPGSPVPHRRLIARGTGGDRTVHEEAFGHALAHHGYTDCMSDYETEVLMPEQVVRRARPRLPEQGRPTHCATANES